MNSDLIDLGEASLDPQTNALLVQAKSTPVDDDDSDAPDCASAPLMGALGVTAIPWPANDTGKAQGIKLDAPGTNGVIVGARDTRVAAVVAELAPGETCIHSTGTDFDSRAFFKDQLAAIVVSNDVAFVLDRKNKKATLSAFGGHLEVSEDGGCYLAHGGAMIRVKDGQIHLMGQIVLGGAAPSAPVLVGLSGPAGVALPGVFGAG